MTTDVGKIHFRLVLLGSNGTGKTSILNRFLFKKFETKYKPTVEDLFCKDFDLGSIEIKVDFLDTSGSMQFPAMRRLSITNGSAFLIVYSVDDESSFEVLKMCIAEIQEIRPDYQEIPIVFAGNKCDLPKERRKVSKELVSNYVYYDVPRLRTKVIECSCKESYNVDSIFRAYLSLAKVSLSSAVYVGLAKHHRRGSRQTTDEAQIDEWFVSLRARGRRPTNDDGAGLPTRRDRVTLARTPTTPTQLTRQTSPNVPQSRSNESGTGGEATHSNSDCGVGGGGGCGLRRGGGGSISNRRVSSMKVALGVRKSCDASIITSMRDVSITVTPEEHKHLIGDSGNNTIFTTSSEEPVHRADGSTGSTRIQTSEVILERALRSKLSLGGRSSEAPKPRSRSLIWRATRSKARASAHPNDQDCRIT